MPKCKNMVCSSDNDTPLRGDHRVIRCKTQSSCAAFPCFLTRARNEEKKGSWQTVHLVSSTGRGLGDMKDGDVLLISGHGNDESIGASEVGQSYGPADVSGRHSSVAYGLEGSLNLHTQGP